MRDVSYLFLFPTLFWAVSCGNGNLDYSYGSADSAPSVGRVSSSINPDGTQSVLLEDGENYVYGCTAVDVNGTTCTSVNVLSSTSLTCQLPSSSIVVTNVTASNAACVYTVFVTSTTYFGDLGGLSGADAKCESVATAAGASLSTASGTGRRWKAVLWSSSETAYGRISLTGGIPIKTVSGVKVADDKTDFWDGSLDSQINIKENGSAVSESQPNVWTGAPSSLFSGPIPSPPPGGGSAGSSESNCSNWTSATSDTNGKSGLLYRSTSEWVMSNDMMCAYTAHLYCIRAD